MRSAILLCAVLVAGCNIEADFSDQIETEILPAEEYQQEIAAIDRVLVRPAPLGEDGVASLEKLLLDVSKRVRERKPDSKFLKVESLELKLLASRAARLSPKGTGAALQNDWMRLRNNLFDDRAWFVRSAADLEYAASVVPPPAPVVTAPPPIVAAPPPIENRETLSGRWQVHSMTVNGVPRRDEELSDSIWLFDPPRLVIGETAYDFTVANGYLEIMKPSGEQGWMKYEVTSGVLRVAFFDELKGKPASFDAKPDQPDPALDVVSLLPVR